MLSPPLRGGGGGRTVEFALGTCSQHVLVSLLPCLYDSVGLILRRFEVFDDDPAVFLESQYPSDDDS